MWWKRLLYLRSLLHRVKSQVKRLRISVVEYLNTAPLVRGFTHGPLKGKYELSFTVPSRCAQALEAGEADVAIIPAIEYQRIANLVILPEMAIASKRRVRSLLLISRVPVREVKSVALDQSSRSTQALTRILCSKWWGIAPEFHEAAPELHAMLRKADAALLIGDPALRLAVELDDVLQRQTSGVMVCPGSAVGFPEVEKLYVYDIVEEWRGMTGLPAVLAVWAARKDAATPELAQDFLRAKEYGLGDLPAIGAEAAKDLKLPAEQLERYLRENIDYSLDEENLRGLSFYFHLAADLELIDRAKPVEIFGATQGERKESRGLEAVRQS